MEGDVLRLFLVTAARARAHEAMSEFFKLYGPQLLASSSSSSSSAAAADGGAGWQDGPPGCDWQEWFVLPYLAHPEREPRFQVCVRVCAAAAKRPVVTGGAAWL